MLYEVITAILDGLTTHDDKLRDPASDEPQQPEFAHNAYRSLKPEIFVAVGICTHLGCSPNYLPDNFAEQVAGDVGGSRRQVSAQLVDTRASYNFV